MAGAAAEIAGDDLELSWGFLPVRSRVNALADASCLLDGTGAHVAEFLSFEARPSARAAQLAGAEAPPGQQLFLCRHTAGTQPKVEVRALRPPVPPEAALDTAPRQLLLCSTQRLFASLVVRGGMAEVMVWEIKQRESYCLVGKVSRTDQLHSTARAMAWVDGASQVSGDVAMLSLLLANEVMMVAVRQSEAGSNSDKKLHITHIGGVSLRGLRPSCFCWARSGTRMLVGGHGQLSCFVWGRPPEWQSITEASEVRHFLCAGHCSDIRPAYNEAFICRMDQVEETFIGSHVGTSLLDEDSLSLPDGQRFRAGGLRSAFVVEVESNPQDAPQEPELGPTLALDTNAAPSAAMLAARGLNIVPQRRILVPLSCQSQARRPGQAGAAAANSSSGDSLRICTADHQEVSGELLATAMLPQGEYVAAGSFDGAGRAVVWKLAPPHRWGRSTASSSGAWQSVVEADFQARVSEQDPTPSLPRRLRGLAMWPSAGPVALHTTSEDGLALHVVLDEVRNERPVFGPPAPGELFHSTMQLPTSRMPPLGLLNAAASAAASTAAASAAAAATMVQPIGAATTASTRGSSPASPARITPGAMEENTLTGSSNTAQLKQIAENVSGIRSELQSLNSGFRDFQTDFRRLVDVMETISRKLPPQS